MVQRCGKHCQGRTLNFSTNWVTASIPRHTALVIGISMMYSGGVVDGCVMYSNHENATAASCELQGARQPHDAGVEGERSTTRQPIYLATARMLGVCGEHDGLVRNLPDDGSHRLGADSELRQDETIVSSNIVGCRP